MQNSAPYLTHEQLEQAFSDPEKKGTIQSYVAFLVHEEVSKDENLSRLLNEKPELLDEVAKMICIKPEISAKIDKFILDLLSGESHRIPTRFKRLGQYSACMSDPKCNKIVSKFLFQLVQEDPVQSQRLNEHPEMVQKILMDTMEKPENVDKLTNLMETILNSKK